MSILKALWFASAIWLLAVGTAGLVFGISSWTGGLILALAGVMPILLARRLGTPPEPSLSQRIQRELH